MSSAVAELNKDIRRNVVNRCPKCGTPHSTGELGPGTHIEVLCRRCKTVFRVHRPPDE
jgi:phage FluMu protein Com